MWHLPFTEVREFGLAQSALIRFLIQLLLHAMQALYQLSYSPGEGPPL